MQSEHVALSNVDHDHATHVRDTDQLHDDARILRGPAACRVWRIKIPALEDFYRITDVVTHVVQHDSRGACQAHVVSREGQNRLEWTGRKIFDVELALHDEVERVDDLDRLVTRAHEGEMGIRLIESRRIIDRFRVGVQRM